MKFTQHIIVHASDEAALRDLLEEEAAPPRPGLLVAPTASGTTRRYMIQADFDSWDSAENERPDAQAWAARLLEVIEGTLDRGPGCPPRADAVTGRGSTSLCEPAAAGSRWGTIRELSMPWKYNRSQVPFHGPAKIQALEAESQSLRRKTG